MSQLFEEIAEGHGKSLSQAAKLFPPSRSDRPVTLSCLFRWVTKGARTWRGDRVKLEAARCSGRWLTTPQAIGRFLAAQTPTPESLDNLDARTPRKRQKACLRAARELEKAGI